MARRHGAGSASRNPGRAVTLVARYAMSKA
jgi:hypothetical protein